MSERDWARYWLDRAYLNASMSTCRRRNVGAVAIRDRRSFADAFNGTAAGTVHCDEGGCARCAAEDVSSGSNLDRCVCVHAEQNLVAWCAKVGIPMLGATVIQTTQPCTDCVKLLYSAGVSEVLYSEDYFQDVAIEYSAMPVRKLNYDVV